MSGRVLLAMFVLPFALAAGCTQTSSRASQAARNRNANSRSSVNVNAAPTPAGFNDADYARHVEQLRQRLPSKEFEVVIEKPFVVVGDGGRRAVEEDARGTVRWAVTLLKQDYFEKDPNEILDIWLFKDSASYNRHARDLFGSEPTTPYGYYSPAHKALVMNIETGGGTLVHEIVHPFVEANFPDCPAWLNEGLGSLYEQSGEQDGHIVGYTNWRLPALQRAIRRGGLTPFKTLLALDGRAFYDDDPQGTHYAQARYLCYYLQERGLLTRFYRDFHAAHNADPTGFDTLKKVLNETDMEAFQKRWEKFVLGLGEERLTPVSP
ncbi:MAG: hypothetical protein QOH49_2341 [Acidobacteriota bacterium]|nr:hypothetical protein [Acidobacteriota bacterium]